MLGPRSFWGAVENDLLSMEICSKPEWKLIWLLLYLSRIDPPDRGRNACVCYEGRIGQIGVLLKYSEEVPYVDTGQPIEHALRQGGCETASPWLMAITIYTSGQLGINM